MSKQLRDTESDLERTQKKMQTRGLAYSTQNELKSHAEKLERDVYALKRDVIMLSNMKPKGTSKGQNASISIDTRPMAQRAEEVFVVLDQDASGMLEKNEVGHGYGLELEHVLLRFEERAKSNLGYKKVMLDDEDEKEASVLAVSLAEWSQFWCETLPQEQGNEVAEFLFAVMMARVRHVEEARRDARRR